MIIVLSPLSTALSYSISTFISVLVDWHINNGIVRNNITDKSLDAVVAYLQLRQFQYSFNLAYSALVEVTNIKLEVLLVSGEVSSFQDQLHH